MFLFKKIKYLILSLLAFITIGVGVGVSYWVFANEGFNNDINSESNIDNIYENYTFGKESITDKYDIYFFPSTYYLYRFANGKDIDGVNKGTTSTPENIYGYLEYDNVSESFIEISGDSSATKGASENQYHIDINGLMNEGAFSDLDSFTNDSDTGGHWEGLTYVYHTNYEENLGTYLSIDIHNGGYQANYQSYIDDTVAITNLKDSWVVKDDTKDVIDVNYKGFANESDRISKGLGSLFNDANDKSSVNLIQTKDNTTYNLLETYDIYDKYSRLEISNPFNQYLEIDDRLGYWSQLDVDKGRYLPIKLSFDSYIDYNLINTLIGDPKTDMGDSNGWFTSKFSGWISVKSIDVGSYESYLPIDGFEYKDQNNLFDFMSNLKQYAEYDEDTQRYVIRLFPTFSNGKNYNAVLHENPKQPANGYRDGIRLDYFSTSDENNNGNTTLSMDTRFFSFKGGTNDTYSYKNTEGQDIELGLNYASINNFSFDDNVKAIELRGTKIDGNSWIQSTESNGRVEHPNKDWLDFKNEYGTVVLGETTKIIDSFKSNQLYNIYAITGLENYVYSYSDPADAISILKSALYDTVEETGNEVLKTGSDFPIEDLKGKQLYDLGTYVIGKPGVYGVYTLLYEEVADLRLVQDVSIIENSNGSYKEDPNNLIDDFVEKEVSGSRGLAMNTDYIYTGNITKSGSTNYISNLNHISLNNPYIYRIDGVDFRYSDTLSFMIVKNGNADNGDFKFNLSPLTDGQGLVSTATELDTEKQNALDEGEEIFENASNFMSFCGVNEQTDENGVKKYDYTVLRLTSQKGNSNDNGKGYYSFIFEYNPSDMSFNVYCYRFKNIFVKIFDKKPDVYGEASGDSSGFLNHSEGEYYTCEYFAGNSINVTSDYYTPVNSIQTGTSTIEDVFEYFVKKRLDSNSETTETTSTSLDTPYKDTIDKNGNSEYYLIDSVSERVIGVAKCKTDFTNKTSTIENVTFSKDLALSKNYVFYVVSKTAYQNYVLANTTK